ncbi:MAG TPA: HAMP domain-containing protein, partial [Pseudomonadales bacterium]|nr:HAMP domain-containing protein [Pseudomonadales bacterium]
MNMQTIKSKLVVFSTLFAALVVGQSAWLSLRTESNNVMLDDYHNRIHRVESKTHELHYLNKDIQQNFQDISATRGLSGHDDGIDNARVGLVKFKETLTELEKIDPDLRKQTAEIMTLAEKYGSVGEKMARAYVDGGPDAGNKLMPAFDELSGQIGGKLDQMVERASVEANASMQQINDNSHFIKVVSLFCAALASVLLVALYWGGRKFINEPLNKLASAAQRLASADSHQNIQIDIVSNDEVGEIARWMNQFISRREHEFQEQVRSAEQNYALRKALDSCQANVMMADNDMHITYLNQSATRMFKDAEADLRKDLPRFNADTLLGANADVFHKNPAHQRNLLETLRQPYKSRVSTGGRTFDLIATPVVNDAGKK